MVRGQVQLAMACNEARKHQDTKAIRWLVNNSQDLESFVLGLPDSFDTMWGVQVWRDVPGYEMSKLFGAIGHLFETCGDRGSFKSEDEWRVRSRACTKTIAVFALFKDEDITVIRNLGELLSDIGGYERTCEVAERSHNKSFAIRWTCLSLLSIRKMLNSPQPDAFNVLWKLATIHPHDGLDFTDTVLMNAQVIDEQFAAACSHIERLRDLHMVFDMTGNEDSKRETIIETLCQNESALTSILDQVGYMEELNMDASLFEVQQQIHKVTHYLIRRLPGIAFHDVDNITVTGPTSTIAVQTTILQALELLANPVRPQFIYISRLLRGLCGVNEKWWASQEFQELDRAMRFIHEIPSYLSQCRPMERQYWRLLDIYGGSFGFALELYFLSVGKLLPTFSPDFQPEVVCQIILTFRGITFDWYSFGFSIGPRQVILNIVLDLAFRDCGILSNVRYPDYVTNELLDLLKNVIEGQADAYIEDTKREILYGNLTRSTMVDPEFLPKARAILGLPALALAPALGPPPAPALAPGPSHGPEPGLVPAPTN